MDKIERAAKLHMTASDVLMLEQLEQTNEHLKDLKEKEMPEMPAHPEVQRVSLEGVELVTIKGDKGEPGENGKDGEPGAQGMQGVPGKDGRDGIDGIDGRDGRDGVDGKDGAPGKDGSPDTPEQIKEKLDSIQYLQNELKAIKEDVSRIPRGGGTSAIGVAQAFKYIAHTEEPAGAIDGVNTTYTVKNTIWWIAGFTLNGEQVAELPNFTYANRTITFATAIPAAYSGKDFECKYIGT